MKQNIIKEITIDALFLALIAIFTFVPYLGIITIGPLSFTTLHILVLIAASLFGWKKGMLVGTFFGVFSLFAAISHPGTLDYFCLNPFISILPRTLFGLLSGLTFDFFKKTFSKNTFNLLIAPLSAILTLIHTILFLLSFYVFGILDIFKITQGLGLSDIINSLNSSYGSFFSFVIAFVSIGAIVEIIAAGIITPLCFKALANLTHTYSYIKIKDENESNKNISKAKIFGYCGIILGIILVIIFIILICVL